MIKLECVTIILIVALLVILAIILVRIIRQEFIHKQCNHICFTCMYKYECDIFRGEV